eukprot:870267-Rhodomonas_salina.2
MADTRVGKMADRLTSEAVHRDDVCPAAGPSSLRWFVGTGGLGTRYAYHLSLIHISEPTRPRLI